jgi:hypothetical protein
MKEYWNSEGRDFMASGSSGSTIWEIRLMLIVSIVAMLWYSAPQLKHTLNFPLQLLNILFTRLSTLLSL